MKVTKNYKLTAEQEAEVETVLAEGRKKYESIQHIVMESEIDWCECMDREYIGIETENENFKEMPVHKCVVCGMKWFGEKNETKDEEEKI